MNTYTLLGLQELAGDFEALPPVSGAKVRAIVQTGPVCAPGATPHLIPLPHRECF